MNEEIFKRLQDQCWIYHTHPDMIDIECNGEVRPCGFDTKKFAELILQEHVELLKQRWYTLNNAKTPANETMRDIGMRVGQKIEVQQCIQLLLNHWRDKSANPTESQKQDS